MKIITTNQFDKEVSQINDKKLLERLLEVVEECQNAKNPSDIPNLKKLKGYNTAYRIRIGNYRIGVVIDKNAIIFSRFLDRKNIYKYFP